MRGKTASKDLRITFPRGRQRRLDEFADASTDTRTLPEPGSTSQRRVAPGTAPSKAATASGTVVRTDSDLSIVLDTLERKVPTIDPSLTLVGGRLHNYALSVGLPFANSLMYSVAYNVRQQKARARRAKMKEKRMPAAGTSEWWSERAWTDQRTPALAIVARGDQIVSGGAGAWTVCSQSEPGTFHHVSRAGVRWLCDCAFSSGTGMACVHVLAVRYKIGFDDSAPVPSEREVACDSCGSTDINSRGVRRNKSGDVQTYACKGCGHRFAGREGFLRRRSDPTNIARALDLYFRGMSIRKVREYLEQVERLAVSHMTVYRWVVHYSRLAAEWMDAQGARTSDRWHIDETVVDVNGKNEYLWNVLDHETRFLLSTHISEDRSLANTRLPIQRAKRATPDRPTDVLSDGMNAYPLAIGKELGRRAKPTDDPSRVRAGWFNPHKRVPSIRAKESNNRIERFHGTEKERFKVMRAFDGEPGTSVLAEGLRVHYNLVRDHQALRMTPGEAAGIPVGPGFRWKRIIEEASKRANL